MSSPSRLIVADLYGHFLLMRCDDIEKARSYAVKHFGEANFKRIDMIDKDLEEEWLEYNARNGGSVYTVE